MPTLPEGDHCLRCKHQASCHLPQKREGTVCGWYNASVDRFVRRERAKHRVVDARLTSGKDGAGA